MTDDTMTDDERAFYDWSDELKAILRRSPGEHAPEQLRVIFGTVLASTCSEPDAGLLAFAAAATCIRRGTVDPEATVEVHVCSARAVTVYERTGAITEFDLSEDDDGRTRATHAMKH